MILSPSFILQSSVALSLMVDMRVWVISRAERTAPAKLEPYYAKLTEIREFVFNCISDFSCEEIKAKGQYHKQSNAEKKRSQIFVRAGKIDCSAYGYRHACEQRTQKYVDNFLHVNSPITFL